MLPRHLLRAMQPLRSSIIRPTSILSTQTPAALQCGRPTFISHRLIASTADESSQQAESPESSIRPSADPPSLRTYPYTLKQGRVVSAGRMDRCVHVDVRHTVWDDFLRKSYPKVTKFRVSDPRNSLRHGDVIEFSSGYPKNRNVRHVVERIITPFGVSIENRPPVMSREERDALRAEKRAAKVARREQRRAEAGIPSSETPGHGKEHIGRIRRLVLERTAGASAPAAGEGSP